MLRCHFLVGQEKMGKMGNRNNILISSAGRRVSLVRLFQSAVKELGIDAKVGVTDISQFAPTNYIADLAWSVPRVSSENFIPSLLDLCIANNIGLVVPTIDTELGKLSENRELFLENGINLLVCDDDLNRICFDKRETQQFFEMNNIPVPRCYTESEIESIATEDFPLLIKPSKGSSGIGVTIVSNKYELEFFQNYLNEPIIQEKLNGEEYTIDLLFDFSNTLLCAVPRLRIETRAGEVSKAITVRDEALLGAVYDVASKLKGARSCVTLQGFRLENGEFRFIEINPRFGGGFPITAAAGANYPKWILQMHMGTLKSKTMQQEWKDGLLMLRYDDEIVIEKQELRHD